MNPKQKPRMEAAALSVTRRVGSTQSITVHTFAFIGSFLAVSLNLISFDRMLLVLTTVVSLEAIYLAIFIQMSLNAAKEAIEEVEQDIDEIQQDVDEIQEDVDEIQQDVDEIQEDIEEEQSHHGK
jgi:peptidoglycan hydrolase CwlO-like protein